MQVDWDITFIISTTKQLTNSRSENKKRLIKPMNDKWSLSQLMKCSDLSEARSNLLEILEIKFIPTHEVKCFLKLFKWGKFCEMSWTAVGRNPFNDQSRLSIQTLLKLEKCSGPSCEYSFKTDVDWSSLMRYHSIQDMSSSIHGFQKTIQTLSSSINNLDAPLPFVQWVTKDYSSVSFDMEQILQENSFSFWWAWRES